MRSFKPSLKEGILITFVGIVGIIRVLDSLPSAGEMLIRMLYTMLFIFIAIVLIGIKTIRDASKQDG